MKLTKKDVLCIFAQRGQVNNHESNAITSRQLAAKYGISERTVRDIWSRRSRRNLTQPAWTVEEVLSENKRKRMGRPPGAKDTAPRQRHAVNNAVSEHETASSDDGTTRQSDTTGSLITSNQSRGNRGSGSGDSTGDSNTNQENSSSGSGRGNSSSGSAHENSSSNSGDSIPQLQDSAAPSLSEQNARNDQLKQAVLSLLNHDFKSSVTAQQDPNNGPVPMHNQFVYNPQNNTQQPTFTNFPTSHHWQSSQDQSNARAMPGGGVNIKSELPVQYQQNFGSLQVHQTAAPAHQPLGYQSQMQSAASASQAHQPSVNINIPCQDPNYGHPSLQPPSSGWMQPPQLSSSRICDASGYSAEPLQRQATASNLDQHAQAPINNGQMPYHPLPPAAAPAPNPSSMLSFEVPGAGPAANINYNVPPHNGAAVNYSVPPHSNGNGVGTPQGAPGFHSSSSALPLAPPPAGRVPDAGQLQVGGPGVYAAGSQPGVYAPDLQQPAPSACSVLSFGAQDKAPAARRPSFEVPGAGPVASFNYNSAANVPPTNGPNVTYAVNYGVPPHSNGNGVGTPQGAPGFHSSSSALPLAPPPAGRVPDAGQLQVGGPGVYAAGAQAHGVAVGLGPGQGPGVQQGGVMGALMQPQRQPVQAASQQQYVQWQPTAAPLGAYS